MTENSNTGDNSQMPPPPPADPASGTPAEYYAQSAGGPAKAPEKSGCKYWILGCGGAGCLVGVLFIAGFAWMMGPGLPKLTNWVLKQVTKEVEAQAFEDLSPEVREEFTDEVKALGEKIRRGELSRNEAQQLLLELQGAISDQKITASEAESLLDLMKELNERGDGEVSF